MEIKSKETGTEVMNLCFQTLSKVAHDKYSDRGGVEHDSWLAVTMTTVDSEQHLGLRSPHANM